MRTLVRGTAELVLTAGLLLAFLVAHLVWGTDGYTHKAQHGLQDDLERQWRNARLQTSPATVSGHRRRPKAVTVPRRPGTAFATLRIPRFGRSYRYAIVEGVSEADLRKGPGHYPGTAGPGRLGNMVISGHRTTYGAPFKDNGELVRGDEILIDTALTTYVYHVTGRDIVRPSTVEVAAPVPFHPGREPRKKLLTLTTCHPKFSAAYRLIIFAELTSTRPFHPDDS
ncbi:class E sortase [Actinomadura sp. BRA 177]|uniref:class E sortase n=1 Tax=Actinomadura sp. BRA 177 TaxID=2745202 RepID=UPI001595A0AD|nr:class E sortase [Actinomadura sp. BRA 177]NVI92797.1 class E sortase [Actinomadura sp. BRA 177]